MAVFGWVFMALIVVLVVYLIWSTARGGDRPRSARGSALEVLGERYARGEIEREEYLQRKKDLGG